MDSSAAVEAEAEEGASQERSAGGEQQGEVDSAADGVGSAQQEGDAAGQEGEGGERGREQGADEERVRAADSAAAPPAAAAAEDSDVVMVSPRVGRAVSDSGSDLDGGYAAEDGGGVVRRPNLGALMTMLVVSLRMQRLVHWVVRKRCLDGLSAENLVDLLAALEVRRRIDGDEWVFDRRVLSGYRGSRLVSSSLVSSSLTYGQRCRCLLERVCGPTVEKRSTGGLGWAAEADTMGSVCPANTNHPVRTTCVFCLLEVAFSR